MSEKISGAEALIRCLLEESVDLVYGYPGGAIMPVYDELYKFKDRLHHVLMRHEQGAVHAAQGYARVTGRVGVAIATSGPGATNLVTGVADAQIDSTPIVCITGQVSKELLGTDAFQETDIIGISTPITKWNYQITDAEEIPRILAKAFYIAKSGRPGPVIIDITKNAQFDLLDFKYKKCTGIRSYKPVPPVNLSDLEDAAALINNARKPMIIFGQGIILSGAEQELKTLVEKAGIPSASTLLGLSALPSDHPLNMGMVGMHGHYAPNKLTNECDVLIALGMRFDDRVTGNLNKYAKQAKIIHFDIDPAEINKNVYCDVAVLGDVKDALLKIMPLVKEKTHEDWVAHFHALYDLEHEKVIKNVLTPLDDAEITMGEVINYINKNTLGEAVIVTDVGQHQMVTSRYAKFTKHRSSITSGGLGTMGFALPAAIGAKMGAPERQVVAVIGDGGMQMTIQELGTIFQTGAAVKVIILNNNFLGMVRQWQELFFDRRYAFTELINPDFVKVGEGFFIKSKKIKERGELDALIKEALDFDGPYLLEVAVEKEENVFPMVPTGASVSDIRLE